MSANTPGPWTLGEGRSGYQAWALIQKNGGDIAICSRQPGNDQCAANARLIAAAPELFDALNALVNAVSPDDNDKSCEPYFRPALKAARTALAKATGVQS